MSKKKKTPKIVVTGVPGADFGSWLLKERDASQVLAVAVPTLRVWRRKRRGPRWVQMGRTIRYRMIDLDAYITQHLQNGLYSPRIAAEGTNAGGGHE